MIINSPFISGSLVATNDVVISGSLTVLGSLSGSLSSASYALTASGIQGGTTNYLPLWTSDTTISSSQAYQTGSMIVVPGTLGVGAAATTGSYTNQLGTTYYPRVNAISTVETNGSIRNPAVSGYTLITGTPTVLQIGVAGYTETSKSNAGNFTGAIIGADFRASHWGSGQVANVAALQGTAFIYSGSATGNLRGVVAQSDYYALSTLTQLFGSHNLSNHYGSGTVTRAWGSAAFIGNRSSGTITNAMGVGIQIQNIAGGTITNAYGVSIGGPNDTWGNLGAGSITNSYGLFISGTIDVGATTRYAIYSDSTSNTYVRGNIGINKTTPDYTLDVNGTGNFSNNLTVTGSLISSVGNTATSNAVVLAASGGFTKSFTLVNNNNLQTRDTGSFQVWLCNVPCTASVIYLYQDPGTSVVINVKKNTSNLLATDLTNSTADTWVSSSTLQNQTFNPGDKLSFTLVNFTGSVKTVTMQTLFNY